MPVNFRASVPVSHEILDLVASPAKGILLTPGTGATRRKTVSFGGMPVHIQERGKENQSQPLDVLLNADAESGSDKTQPELSRNRHQSQSKLTKTLIELSRKGPGKEAVIKSSELNGISDESISDSKAQEPVKETEPPADTTVDLSQPRSRSGQHWKIEYEQYHRRSNREMKKIIKYGQNVKSYAVKKDSEASCLKEKLKQELSKVAAMEAKISKLAKRLSIAQDQGPEGESDQTRLVSELAQQTALAICYKQKADRCRRAIGRQKAVDVDEKMNESQFWQDAEADGKGGYQHQSEQASLREQLGTLRQSAKAAEEKAMKSEIENHALKRSLARVKEEMMSYETRRQAREDKMKQREEKHKNAKEELEAQLALLKAERQVVLSKSETHPLQDSNEAEKSNSHMDAIGNVPAATTTADNLPQQLKREVRRPYISPRERRSQISTVDIWTFSSPEVPLTESIATHDSTDLPPSSIKQDIHEALKEINQNLLHEQQQSTVQPTKPHPGPLSPPARSIASASQQSPRSHSSNSTPRPFQLNRASGPVKLPPSDACAPRYPKLSHATLGRSASLASRVSSRTNTMGSERNILPPDRAAAAKARLAMRSEEKARSKDG